MMTRSDVRRRQRQAAAMFRKAGVVITPREAAGIEVADCGLGRFYEIGLGVLVYVNTERCCAKELALRPRQTFPEHRHPPVRRRTPARRRRSAAGGAWSISTFRSPEPGDRRRGLPKAGKRPSRSGTRWH